MCIHPDTLTYMPRVRVKNLTDSDDGLTLYASKWVPLTATSPLWYGVDEDSQKITVPVIPSTSQKEIDLDIEVSLERDQGQSEGFNLYGAFPYEYTDQPLRKS
jgi:hypothetical protein